MNRYRAKFFSFWPNRIQISSQAKLAERLANGSHMNAGSLLPGNRNPRIGAYIGEVLQFHPWLPPTSTGLKVGFEGGDVG